MMKLGKQINQFKVLGALVTVLLMSAPMLASAGNVGWNVSVGGGYGGGWRPAAYGSYGAGWGRGWGPGWGGGWRGNWGYAGGYYAPYAAYYGPPVVYAAPPVVAYTQVTQPMVLAAQPQPQVWYFCQSNGKYFPYTQDCPTGWQTVPATPPVSSAPQRGPQY